MLPFSLPILLYHNVCERGSDITAVSPEQFQSHLAVIHSLGFQTYSIAELLSIFESGQPVPRNAISIQFDDGYIDTYEIAAPLLEKFSFRATIFLIAAYIGKNNSWDHRIDQFLRHMGNSEIEDLIGRGFEMAAHSCSHHNLRKFDFPALNEEIVKCREILEGRFQTSFPFFSYPYGEFDARVKSVAKRSYDIAFSVTSGTNDWHRDRYAIIRYQVNRQTKIKDIRTYIQEHNHVNF